MDYIDQTLTRASLPQIVSFLLYGTDGNEEPKRPCVATLEQSSRPIHNRLQTLCGGDREQLEAATGELCEALATSEEVYMELGMQAGARLLYQLLGGQTGKAEPKKKAKNNTRRAPRKGKQGVRKRRVYKFGEFDIFDAGRRGVLCVCVYYVPGKMVVGQVPGVSRE